MQQSDRTALLLQDIHTVVCVLCQPDIYGIQAFSALLHFINYFVIFPDRCLETADVHEDIFRTILRSYKSETF